MACGLVLIDLPLWVGLVESFWWWLLIVLVSSIFICVKLLLSFVVWACG